MQFHECAAPDTYICLFMHGFTIYRRGKACFFSENGGVVTVIVYTACKKGFLDSKVGIHEPFLKFFYLDINIVVMG